MPLVRKADTSKIKDEKSEWYQLSQGKDIHIDFKLLKESKSKSRIFSLVKLFKCKLIKIFLGINAFRIKFTTKRLSQKEYYRIYYIQKRNKARWNALRYGK